MQKKYQEVIEHINRGVFEFNDLLLPQYKFKSISSSDPQMFRVVAPGKWGGDVWPSSECKGVYFLLASQDGQEGGNRLGVYVGKATMHTIGGRLAAHTKKYRNSPAFYRQGPDGNCRIVAIAAIAIEQASQVYIAASLEEFLIARGFGDFGSSLNIVGVRPRYGAQAL